jgi:hypothetical protein
MAMSRLKPGCGSQAATHKPRGKTKNRSLRFAFGMTTLEKKAGQMARL